MKIRLTVLAAVITVAILAVVSDASARTPTITSTPEGQLVIDPPIELGLDSDSLMQRTLNERNVSYVWIRMNGKLLISVLKDSATLESVCELADQYPDISVHRVMNYRTGKSKLCRLPADYDTRDSDD